MVYNDLKRAHVTKESRNTIRNHEKKFSKNCLIKSKQLLSLALATLSAAPVDENEAATGISLCTGILVKCETYTFIYKQYIWFLLCP